MCKISTLTSNGPMNGSKDQDCSFLHLHWWPWPTKGSDIQVYLVVGGWSSNNHALDSTEVFSGGAWMTVGALPVAVSGSRGFTFGSSFYMTGLCLVFHCSATQSWIVRRLGGFCHKIPRWGMEVWCWHPILERYWAQVAQANLLPHCWHCWILSRWIILVLWGRPSDFWH